MAGNTAVVHIGPVGDRAIVQRFYERSGLESLGPGRVPVSDRLPFDTLEGLIDNMAQRSETIHIVVAHGSELQGLLMKYVPHAHHNATGEAIGRIADATEVVATLDKKTHTIQDLASRLGTTGDATLRLLNKFSNLRKVQRIVAFRGCNVGQNPSMLRDYKRAFGAVMVNAPNCRMFYLRIHPNRTTTHNSIDHFRTTKPKTGKTRRRIFESDVDFALQEAGPIVIDVRDIDGHSNVKAYSYMDKPKNAVSWAVEFNGAWRQSPSGNGSDDFVMEALWDNDENSFHTCRDMSYATRLVSV